MTNNNNNNNNNNFEAPVNTTVNIAFRQTSLEEAPALFSIMLNENINWETHKESLSRLLMMRFYGSIPGVAASIENEAATSESTPVLHLFNIADIFKEEVLKNKPADMMAEIENMMSIVTTSLLAGCLFDIVQSAEQILKEDPENILAKKIYASVFMLLVDVTNLHNVGSELATREMQNESATTIKVQTPPHISRQGGNS